MVCFHSELRKKAPMKTTDVTADRLRAAADKVPGLILPSQLHGLKQPSLRIRAISRSFSNNSLLSSSCALRSRSTTCSGTSAFANIAVAVPVALHRSASSTAWSSSRPASRSA